MPTAKLVKPSTLEKKEFLVHTHHYENGITTTDFIDPTTLKVVESITRSTPPPFDYRAWAEDYKENAFNNVFNATLTESPSCGTTCFTRTVLKSGLTKQPKISSVKNYAEIHDSVLEIDH